MDCQVLADGKGDYAHLHNIAKGDTSITEVILCNKIPFYELVDLKIGLMQGFYDIALKKFGETSPSAEFFKEFLNTAEDQDLIPYINPETDIENRNQLYAMKFVSYAKKEGFHSQMIEINKEINEKHFANKKLVEIIKNTFLTKIDDGLNDKINLVEKAFLENSITQEQAKLNVDNLIKETITKATNK